ncbi:MAG: hypothetical protein QOJ09_2650 [Actinomycetota bacterium]|nr:hypothetical protein [Actinomycetota bacterium]
MTSFILRRVEVEGNEVDVSVVDGVVAEVGVGVAGAGDEIDGEGGALIPGLHDHHLHLFAMAAADDSVDVTGDALAALWAADATLPPGAWIRAVGWHESAGWELDRRTLDHAVSRRPVRVQHSSGALWVLNTAALELVGLADHETGRLFGMDVFLRERLEGTPPDLRPVSRALASAGITAVTDATPYERIEDAARLQAGMTQPVRVMGAPGLDVSSLALVGPAKIVVADHDPPSIDALVARVIEARRHDRNVAFHCASRVALVLTLSALEQAGARAGDRIEHGAVIPDDAVPTLRRLGLTVVTQPAFIRARGDRYLAEVDVDDRPFLWRCGSLLRAGVAVLGSSDGPYGPADPWRAMRTAVDRRTASGTVLGPDDAVTPEQALALYTAARRVAPRTPADLCLLRVPLAEALAALDADAVRLTVIGGDIVGT